MTEPDRDELTRRITLARSILTHRPTNHTTRTLALAALDGIPATTLTREVIRGG